MASPVLASKRLRNELADIQASMPCLIKSVGPKAGNLFVWEARIKGPPGSVYENGTFHLELQFGSDYPLSPPKVRFLTKILHCNISSRGQICLDILKQEFWSAGITVSSLLTSIQSLLSECNPNHPLQLTVNELCKNDKEKHDEIARKWTMTFANEA